MKATLKLYWSNHQHDLVTVTPKIDNFKRVLFSFCLRCDSVAKQSGISDYEYFKHPRGCRCYWCSFNCENPKLLERERR